MFFRFSNFLENSTSFFLAKWGTCVGYQKVWDFSTKMDICGCLHASDKFHMTRNGGEVLRIKLVDPTSLHSSPVRLGTL